MKKMLSMIIACLIVISCFTAMPVTAFAQTSDINDGDSVNLKGWQEVEGVKYYYNDDGTLVKGWLEIEGVKYYFDENGAMVTGWKNIEEKRYYFDNDGKPVDGWQKINNFWYFFDKTELQTGWKYISNNWYYFKETAVKDETEIGIMATGWIKLDEKWFFLSPDTSNEGIMLKGFQIINDIRYYLYEGSNTEKGILEGQMATGWTEVGEDKYFFTEDGAPLTGWQIIDETRYMFDKYGKAIKGAKEFIIDVSKWQGKVDWTLIKGKVDGVIARTSHGSGENWKDIEFENYIKALNELKIPYGLYHYNEATTVEEAKKEAQMAIEYVKSTDANPTLPFFIDIEQDGGKCDLIAIAKVYIEEFIKNGYMPGIYANQNYWRNYLNDPEFTLYYRWIANYGKNDGTANPEFAPEDGIENYMMWQYTSVAILDGITENSVDCNILFDWYKKADGWKLYEGRWFYYKDGYLLSNWQIVDNKWYFFKNNGEMGTGWQHDGKDWYLLDNDGMYQTGWHFLGGKWYLMDASGRMATGWRFVSGNWYYFAADGEMVTGWVLSGGIWYFMDASGAMQTGWMYVSGQWYYFNASGAMVSGWQFIDNEWYYFNTSGEMFTGWLLSGGHWYLLKVNGAMAANCYVDNYWFNADGIWVEN